MSPDLTIVLSDPLGFSWQAGGGDVAGRVYQFTLSITNEDI